MSYINQSWNRVKRIDPRPDPTRSQWLSINQSINQLSHFEVTSRTTICRGITLVIFMNILKIFISAFIHVTTCKRHQPSYSHTAYTLYLITTKFFLMAWATSIDASTEGWAAKRSSIFASNLASRWEIALLIFCRACRWRSICGRKSLLEVLG